MSEAVNNLFGIKEYFDPDEPVEEIIKQAPPLTGTEINIYLDDYIPY